jgi:hypothetical protein
MNAKDRYRNAQQAARSGRYEEALREHIWFHNHALDEQPALYGVRLSYALTDWIDLGKAYPPAMDALKEIRDAKSAQLRRAEGNRATFHDVEAINASLNDHESTYQLFVEILKVNPTIAKECADLAMPSIVHARDFALARTFVKDPEATIRKWTRLLNEDIADLAKEPPRKAPVQEGYVHFYAQRIRLLLAILVGVGEQALAESIRETALACIESVPVRDAVNDAISHDEQPIENK